jgi:hypothetical protein
MGRFTNYLKQRNPISGRQVRESGDFYNLADYSRLKEQTNIETASRLSNLYRGFWQGSIPANTTYNFVIDIPEGIDLFGFTRISTALENTLFTTFLSCRSFVSAEGPIDGLSFDRRLGKRNTSQCKIHRASSLSGVVTHSPETGLIVPATGATTNRSPSSQTEAGAQPAFDITEIPAFRYENKTGAIAKLDFYIFWQELPTE